MRFSVTASLVRFKSGSDHCVADLYLPDGNGPNPIIVMAHGLGGTRNMRLPAFATRFVEAGYACLVFDYRYFGESEGYPRQLIDISCQLSDWKSAIAFARTLERVDENRVILWGTSFSGGHVLQLGATEANLAAIISQCPFTDGLASGLAVSPWVSLKLTGVAVLDRLGAFVGAKPRLVPVAGRAGETALMTAWDAYDGYLNLVPPGARVVNLTPARFALDIIRYYPGRRTANINAPVLCCVCNDDSVAPTAKTLKHIARIPKKEVRRYNHGHFEIYIGDAFEEVVEDQLDFLKRVVPVDFKTNKKRHEQKQGA